MSRVRLHRCGHSEVLDSGRTNHCAQRAFSCRLHATTGAVTEMRHKHYRCQRHIQASSSRDAAHLYAALLVLVLRTGKARAPDHRQPVLDELLDQRKVAVVQQLQQVALQVRQALPALCSSKTQPSRNATETWAMR